MDQEQKNSNLRIFRDEIRLLFTEKLLLHLDCSVSYSGYCLKLFGKTYVYDGEYVRIEETGEAYELVDPLSIHGFVLDLLREPGMSEESFERRKLSARNRYISSARKINKRYNNREVLYYEEALLATEKKVDLNEYHLECAPSEIKTRDLKNNEIVVGSDNVCYHFPPEQSYELTVYSDFKPSEIKVLVDAVMKEVQSHQDKIYLFTKIGCGDGNFSITKMASFFDEIIWLKNVRLPEPFIDEIARRVKVDPSYADNFSTNKKKALVEWRKRGLRKRAMERYGDIFSVLPSQYLFEAINLVTAADEDEYDDGRNLNAIRCCMDGIFAFLVGKGVLERKKGLSDYGEAIKKCKEAPVHVKRFAYAVNAVVNPGSHIVDEYAYKPVVGAESFENYRLSVNNGDLRYLTKTLTYMVLNILEWCLSLQQQKGEG